MPVGLCSLLKFGNHAIDFVQHRHGSEREARYNRVDYVFGANVVNPWFVAFDLAYEP